MAEVDGAWSVRVVATAGTVRNRPGAVLGRSPCARFPLPTSASETVGIMPKKPRNKSGMGPLCHPAGCPVGPRDSLPERCSRPYGNGGRSTEWRHWGSRHQRTSSSHWVVPSDARQSGSPTTRCSPSTSCTSEKDRDRRAATFRAMREDLTSVMPSAAYPSCRDGAPWHAGALPVTDRSGKDAGSRRAIPDTFP